MDNDMRIGMILEREFPFDERVEKEALSLIEKGHTVHIVSFNYGALPEYERYKGIHVHRFKISREAFNKLNPLHRVLPVYKFIWMRAVNKFLKSQDIDVIHVHDLPLADIGARIKKRKNIPLVLDQHELWSETVKHYRHYNTFIGKIVKWLSRWAHYERKQFKIADMIITVEEPIKNWYIENTGVSADKVIVVPNTPLKSAVDYAGISGKPDDKKFRLYYAGKIDINRYLETVIKALVPLSETIPTIQFDIAGKYAKGFDPRVAAKKYKAENYVNYLGELSFSDMMKRMAEADLCISFLPVYSEELNRTIVTKVYQYIQLSKPILVGRTHYIKEFVEKHGIGMSVNEEDPLSVQKAVAYLYEHRDILEQYSQNADRIKEDHIWEKTVKPLVEFYEQL